MHLRRKILALRILIFRIRRNKLTRRNKLVCRKKLTRRNKLVCRNKLARRNKLAHRNKLSRTQTHHCKVSREQKQSEKNFLKTISSQNRIFRKRPISNQKMKIGNQKMKNKTTKIMKTIFLMTMIYFLVLVTRR